MTGTSIGKRRCPTGKIVHRHRQDRLGARLRPLVTWPMVVARSDSASTKDERRVMCGDRVVTPDGWTGRT